jgi:thioredoxin 2
MVAPEFTKVAREGAGRWIVVKVNTEEARSLGARFRVTSIPTMAVLVGGREIARQMGAMPAARIQQFLEQAIATQR